MREFPFRVVFAYHIVPHKDTGVKRYFETSSFIWGKAEGEKEATILEAEATKQAAIKKAEGEAEAIKMVQEATAMGLKMLKEAGATKEVLTLKSLEAFERAADGNATKIIIPSEIQGMAGLASALTTIVADGIKDTKAVSNMDKIEISEAEQ